MTLKRALFRYYLLIVAAFAAAAAVITSSRGWTTKPEALGSIVAVALGFVYFVQRQKLDETRLFSDLFCAFNKRYDRLNAKLSRMATKSVLDGSDEDIAIDYFNLCAEEYLFYREGYVLPEVWTAWCRGMWQYVGTDGALRHLWQREVTTGSYYGLTLNEIERGAKLQM